MFRILFLHKRHPRHLWKRKKISIPVLVCYVFLLHSSLKIPENKRYGKWERSFINLFECFFETNGLFWLFCKMIIKENCTPYPWHHTIKKKHLIEKKELGCDQMLAVTGKCLCKCLIIYVKLPKSSSPRTKWSAQECQNISLPEQKSLMVTFLVFL